MFLVRKIELKISCVLLSISETARNNVFLSSGIFGFLSLQVKAKSVKSKEPSKYREYR